MNIKEYLETHGINLETTKKFGIYPTSHRLYGDRITFPVKDIDGNFLFNKYRNLTWVKGGNTPKFVYDAGSNVQLYNLQSIKDSKYAFLFEGEPDVWKASEDGIPGVCSTSGAETINQNLVKHLIGKKVIICYDTDPAGQSGAKKVVKIIPNALIVNLPSEVKDYCEYRKKYSRSDFKELVKQIIRMNGIKVVEPIKDSSGDPKSKKQASRSEPTNFALDLPGKLKY